MEMATTPASTGAEPPKPAEHSDQATVPASTGSLALLTDAQRIEVLRERARVRRASGEIPDRFGARVDQHFNQILRHVRPADDTDDPLIAAAALLQDRRSAAPGAPVAPDRMSRAKRKLETLGVSLDRNDRDRAELERVATLEQTVLALIERVRELERREHRVTALTDRVDELHWKVRKLRRDARAARAPRPHEPEDLDDDSFDDDEFELDKKRRDTDGATALDTGPASESGASST